MSDDNHEGKIKVQRKDGTIYYRNPPRKKKIEGED